MYAHNTASEGAGALATALGARRIRHTRSAFRGSANHTVINWGAHEVSEQISKCKILNLPGDIRISANKRTFFEAMSTDEPGPRTVPWTTDQKVVKDWLASGHTIAARTILNGSGGAGLSLFDATQTFVNAELYTQYVKKKEEYRIHVVGKKVISVQRKAKRKLEDGQAYTGDVRIRNLENGFVFVRENVTPQGDVLTQSLKVFDKIGLDFGAVDVIWNERSQQAYVLEVNTAPGLEGQTIEHYAHALGELVK